jgi:hypothetical protein
MALHDPLQQLQSSSAVPALGNDGLQNLSSCRTWGD